MAKSLRSDRKINFYATVITTTRKLYNKGLRDPSHYRARQDFLVRGQWERWKGWDFQEEQTDLAKAQRHETAGPTQGSTGS